MGSSLRRFCMVPGQVRALAAVACLACVTVAAMPAGGQTGAFDLHGKPVDPLQAGRGIVVLVFVRGVCPITNRYAPVIQKLSAEYAGKAVFWLVYPDKAETAAACAQASLIALARTQDPQFVPSRFELRRERQVAGVTETIDLAVWPASAL